MGRAAPATNRVAAIAATLFVVSLVVPVGTAAVETETFGFEPWPTTVAGAPRSRFDLRLPPGGGLTEQARIYNKTDQARTYRLYGADVVTDPRTGNPSTTGPDADVRGVGSWIEIGEDDRDLELGPNESRIIDFRIERPSDATVGGVGAIVAEELAPAEPGGGISVRFRIALRIDATENSIGEGLVVEELDLDVPLQFLPNSGTARTVIRNGDPDTITAKVQLHVDRGGSRFVLVQEEISLRPGDRAEYEAEWTSVPLFGGTATPGVELAWEAGDLFLDGDSVFVLPLWVPVMLLVIAVNLLLRAVVKRNQDDAERVPHDA